MTNINRLGATTPVGEKKSRSEPEQPKVVCHLVYRMQRPMVSKAADMSSGNKADTRPLSKA